MPAVQEEPTVQTEALLRFWFGEASDEALVARQQQALWWGKDPAQDALLRSRFESAVQAEAHGEWAALQAPRELLARILLLDQLPRAIYRDTPPAFAYDARARELAGQLLHDRRDRQLRAIERVFAYLPLEHSEQLTEQQQSLTLFAELRDNASEPLRPLFQSFATYAERHWAVIARFGRFPHRNVVLGRSSTVEELQFLQQPGSSF
jgi:uncharacterized protein (DUF924 family)